MGCILSQNEPSDKPGPVHNVAIMRVADFDFPGTPALVFVDARNHVVASWLGWLSPTLEDEVIAAIEELAR